MQQELNISEYWHVLLKRKWVVIFTSVLFFGFSTLFAYLQTPVYKTSSYVRIDQYKTVMNVISDLLRWSPGEIMSTEVETIQGPIVLGQVAREVGMLDADAGESTYFAIVSQLRKMVSAERVERTNMIRIDVTGNSAQRTADIANMVAKVYKEISRENRIKDIKIAREFVEDQLDKAKDRLRDSEDALRNYKELNGTLSVDSETQITLERLNSFENDLLQTRRERAGLETEMSQLEKRIAEIDLEREVSDLKSAPIETMYTNLVQTRTRINSLLLTHTESNPELTELRGEEKRLTAHLISETRKQLELRIGDLDSRLDSLAKREHELSRLVNREIQRIPDKDLELSRLTREVSVNEELYMMLNREFKEAQIKEMGMVSEVTLVSPAIAPKNPIKPNKRFTITIGLILGLVLGCVLAALVESFDTSIGAIEDIERLLAVPVLAAVPRFDHALHGNGLSIPFFSKRKKKATPEKTDHGKLLPSIFNPTSAEAEAYRHLRTNLQFDRIKDNKKIYLVSSSGSQEGKSVTLSNLAVVMAQGGQRTLLISCNLRRPTIYKIFGISRKPGLTDVLIGSATLEEAIHTFADIVVGEMDWEPALKLPGIDNLDILPAGTLPPNPTELIESQRFDDLLNKFRKEYDVILMDAPPALPVTDSLLLGPKADGVILIYQLGHLPRRALIRAKKIMDSLGINVIGIVLNDVRPEFHGVAPVYISREYMKATEKVFRAGTSPSKEEEPNNGN